MSSWRGPERAASSTDQAPEPSLDSETGLLRTVPDGGTRQALDAADADLVATRTAEHLRDPVPSTSYLHELRGIHPHPFEDVRARAGELRTVDVRKDVFGAGCFLPWQDVARAMDSVRREQEEEPWSESCRAAVSDRLAHFYELVASLHPFREGTAAVKES